MPDEELGEGNEYRYMYDVAEAGTAQEVTVPGNQTWADAVMSPGHSYILVLRTSFAGDKTTLSNIKLFRFFEIPGTVIDVIFVDLCYNVTCA